MRKINYQMICLNCKIKMKRKNLHLKKSPKLIQKKLRKLLPRQNLKMKALRPKLKKKKL